MLKTSIEDLKKSAKVVKPEGLTAKKPIQKQNKFKKKKVTKVASPAVVKGKKTKKNKKNKKAASTEIKQEEGDDAMTNVNMNGAGTPKPGPDDNPAFYKKLQLADQKGRTIVVSNFKFETTVKELHKFFSKYGKVRR